MPPYCPQEFAVEFRGYNGLANRHEGLESREFKIRRPFTCHFLTDGYRTVPVSLVVVDVHPVFNYSIEYENRNIPQA